MKIKTTQAKAVELEVSNISISKVTINRDYLDKVGVHFYFLDEGGKEIGSSYRQLNLEDHDLPDSYLATIRKKLLDLLTDQSVD